MKPPAPAIEFAYEWTAGSVPPPHHYRYAIRGSTAEGARAQIEYVPGYAFESAPQWVAPFELDPAAAAALVRVLDQQAVWTRRWQAPAEDRIRAVGGSQRSLRLTRDSTVSLEAAELSPDDRTAFDAIETAVRALVPEPLWRELRERHAAHIASAAR